MPIPSYDRDGNPVNALHGFARFLGDLIERVRPEHIAVAFDATLVTSFRNTLFPAYKANREPAPDDLKRQFMLCRRVCDGARRRQLLEQSTTKPTTSSVRSRRACAIAGKSVVLVTRDKDLVPTRAAGR